MTAAKTLSAEETAIAVAEANRLFEYRADGTLVRKVTTGGRPAGSTVGGVHHDGYLQAKFLGRHIQVHRLVWLMHRGELPAVLDHINGVRHDNRIENLRSVSHAVNSQNRRAATSVNKTGFLGVMLVARNRDRPFVAAIRVSGRQKELGCFATAEQAHEAYVMAKRRLHAGCTL